MWMFLRSKARVSVSQSNMDFPQGTSTVGKVRGAAFILYNPI